MTREIKVKICLMGEGEVGKTSLIKRFVLEMFDDKYLATLGTKVTKKVLDMRSSDLNANITMMIWDIMGQKGFRLLLKEAYFYGANAGLLISDCTRRKTLDDLEEWIGSIREIAGNIPMVVLANKSDLVKHAEFGEAELKEFAKAHDMACFMTSAKTGDNVDEAFEKLARILVEKTGR